MKFEITEETMAAINDEITEIIKEDADWPYNSRHGYTLRQLLDTAVIVPELKDI
jgi:hypothetical protein